MSNKRILCRPTPPPTRRLANLELTKGQNSGPPPEQNVPIRVPKKTRLYIEQTQREKVGVSRRLWNLGNEKFVRTMVPL